MTFGLRAIEEPALVGGLFFIGGCTKTVGTLHGDLLAVGIAEHIPMEDDAAHARELDAAGLDMIAGSVEEAFFTFGEEPADFIGSGIVEASVGPMSVGAEEGRDLALGLSGSVEIAGHKEAWKALEEDIFDGVAVACLFGVNLWLKLGEARHGVEAEADHQLLANLCGA